MNKPSELIKQHIEGHGNGFQLDDIISEGGEYISATAQEILLIHEKYKTEEFPIGTSNPACFDELRLLADRLSDQGF